jgi:hypothetical protein
LSQTGKFTNYREINIVGVIAIFRQLGNECQRYP